MTAIHIRYIFERKIT